MLTHGNGISMGTTKSRLLDLTRLVSRAGRTMTGVDRVEFAYLDHLLTRDLPLYGLVRSTLGYILLDPAGCAALRDRCLSGEWGKAGALSRLAQRRDPMRARADSDLRRLCLDRCIPQRLGAMLKRHFPGGTTYLNTGHSNLTQNVTTALRILPDTRIAVLVHDTIPLDYPQFQRPGTVERFTAFLNRVGETADIVICNSDQTRRDVLRHLSPKCPQTIVAHLGVTVPKPGLPPRGPWTAKPYFVALGTIEPRKNHAFLLDLWPGIRDAHLLICGARGWNNDAVFARLDARPDRVHELNGLSDPEVWGLLRDAAGLLFPSLAEGYGLPPLEAAALGVPVICADLPIYQEVISHIPIYAIACESYPWQHRINKLVEDQQTRLSSGGAPRQSYAPPSWDAHFKTVLTLV